MRVPYLLVLQHHIVAGTTRIVAPVAPAGPGPDTLLAPWLMIGPVRHRVVLLEMASVPVTLLGDTVEGAEIADTAVINGLDAIFRGYSVGLPLH